MNPLLQSLRRRLGSLSRGDLGPAGERAAEYYLKEKGFRILERNFRVRGGEIDLIGEGEGRIVAFEVKTRRSGAYGTAAEAVTAAKAKRLRFAAMAYMRRHGYPPDRLRIDVVAIEERNGRFEIRHYPSAVGAGDRH